MAQKKPTLHEFENRLAVVVTDLNGFRSAVINGEITLEDINQDLIDLFAKLRAVEQTVEQLGNVFYSH